MAKNDLEMVVSIVSLDEVSFFTAEEVLGKLKKTGGTIYNMRYNSNDKLWHPIK